MMWPLHVKPVAVPDPLDLLQKGCAQSSANRSSSAMATSFNPSVAVPDPLDLSQKGCAQSSTNRSSSAMALLSISKVLSVHITGLEVPHHHHHVELCPWLGIHIEQNIWLASAQCWGIMTIKGIQAPLLFLPSSGEALCHSTMVAQSSSHYSSLGERDLVYLQRSALSRISAGLNQRGDSG